ncbi:hypothetical protein FDK38_002099 [Candidozyma auris]|nr:hypothetical protein FDK38_002099 [[Candida] auris]
MSETPELSPRSDDDGMLSDSPQLNHGSSLSSIAMDDEKRWSPSEVGSESEGGKDLGNTVYSSASESESQSVKAKEPRKKKGKAPTPGSGSGLSPKQKKKVRRKSRNSDVFSEKSHRSELHGSGYTSTPAAGKIFRNLLILEESLRQQVMQQRALRRKYLTFLAVLCSLIAFISHHLYFNDHSASVRVSLQLMLLALSVTLMLYHLSGEYQKTIVLPRKFLSSTNKGLRQLNLRLVKIKTSMTDTTVDLIREAGLFLCTMCLRSCHTVYPSMIQNPNSRLEVFLVSAQSQCQPRFGLTDVKLTLLPRSFNTDIREGWELYRNEFWVNEGVRRRIAMMEFVSGPAEDKSRAKKEKKERRKPRIPAAKDLLNPHQANPANLDGLFSPQELSKENLEALGKAESLDMEASF